MTDPIEKILSTDWRISPAAIPMLRLIYTDHKYPIAIGRISHWMFVDGKTFVCGWDSKLIKKENDD